MAEFSYTITQPMLRSIERGNTNLGLQLYQDVLGLKPLEPYQYCQNTGDNFYRILAFLPARLHSVFELIGTVWTQRFDWKLLNDYVIFIERPKGVVLLISTGTLYSLFRDSINPVIPLWLKTTDTKMYKNIELSGYKSSLQSTGPWVDTLSIATLPIKVYIQKSMPSANVFKDLTLTFEVY